MCHKEVSNRLIQKASGSNDITKQERLEWLTSQMGCFCERNTGKEHVILCTSWTYLMSRILSDFQVAKLEQLFHGRRKAFRLELLKWSGIRQAGDEFWCEDPLDRKQEMYTNVMNEQYVLGSAFAIFC